MDTAKFRLTSLHGDRGQILLSPGPRKPIRSMSLRELFYHSSVEQIVKAIKTEGTSK